MRRRRLPPILVEAKLTIPQEGDLVVGQIDRHPQLRSRELLLPREIIGRAGVQRRLLEYAPGPVVHRLRPQVVDLPGQPGPHETPAAAVEIVARRPAAPGLGHCRGHREQGGVEGRNPNPPTRPRVGAGIGVDGSSGAVGGRFRIGSRARLAEPLDDDLGTGAAAADGPAEAAEPPDAEREHGT